MAGKWADAAHEALKRLAVPSTVSQIFAEMQRVGFYHSSDLPKQTLRNEIRRNCDAVDHIAPSPDEPIFIRHSRGKYGLKEWIERGAREIDSSTSEIISERAQVPQVIFPNEVEPVDGIPEGNLKQIFVNVFERNPKTRNLCLAAHGRQCSVCDRTFESEYGELAKGFIHVHHLRPLAEVRSAHDVDPVKDLRPICPNCHAVVHMRKPALSIEEARALFHRH